MIKKGDYWWPEHDIHCRSAVAFEQPMIPRIVQMCRKLNVCVQAGGNVGIFPIDLSLYFSKVITFEPDKENFECLLKNIEPISSISAVPCALGNKQDLVNMHREFDNCGAHFIEGKGNIPVSTIDAMELKDCNLIWLDIEGYEYLALLGAMKTIRAYHPLIVCEEKGLGRRNGFNIDDKAISELLLRNNYIVATKINNDVVYRPSC